MAPVSAGLLLYRLVAPASDAAAGTGSAARGRTRAVEVLLAHMGGPFWARRERAWTVPKGLVEPDEDPHAAALREFAEELGFAPPAPLRDDEPLGEVRQSGGKRVHAWAREGDVDVATLVGPPGAPDVDGGTPVTSNLVTVEWPPRSGRTLEVPEIDRVAWVRLDDARGLVVAAQEGLLDRIVDLVAARD
ncbi:NUDIX domain-containing protein [Cellulomonas palmilytica]|uniref:NUDIX domain-containing protein n=1 Tax=Cellulomonas palmilytica TaxID=2608402 RepID=UPI001F206DB9|nr:NUDIX domain-containing protein [Cellulomonas palmilytica]UJP39990.1 NUDIX domain-containing protein [Cellulomonas palmilytica]